MQKFLLVNHEADVGSVAADAQQDDVAGLRDRYRRSVLGQVPAQRLVVLGLAVLVGGECQAGICQRVADKGVAGSRARIAPAYVGCAFHGLKYPCGNASPRNDIENETRNDMLVRFVENPSTSNSIGPRSITFGVSCSTAS